MSERIKEIDGNLAVLKMLAAEQGDAPADVLDPLFILLGSFLKDVARIADAIELIAKDNTTGL